MASRALLLSAQVAFSQSSELFLTCCGSRKTYFPARVGERLEYEHQHVCQLIRLRKDAKFFKSLFCLFILLLSFIFFCILFLFLLVTNGSYSHMYDDEDGVLYGQDAEINNSNQYCYLQERCVIVHASDPAWSLLSTFSSGFYVWLLRVVVYISRSFLTLKMCLLSIKQL